MLWLKAQAADRLDGTVEGVRDSLQLAIELEHSTIPPYLYALYSLKPESNREIAKIIKSVVLEEMLHMSLACNVLNAVGGRPEIDSPRFIPNYPTPLPGTVESGLVVPLAAFSMDILTGVFMVIEEPEKPLEIPVIPPLMAMSGAPAQEDKALTIGEFYEKIMEQIAGLSCQGIFTGEPNRQLRTTFEQLPIFPVTDEKSALRALGLIVDQGEGTKTSPFDKEKEPAHYYRYAEIYEGYSLIPNPDHSPGAPPYIYGGAPLKFDPKGVLPVVKNPDPSMYPAGSPAALANESFNQTYTALLQGLHAAFNGEPDRLAPALVGMQALHQLASYMMTIEFEPGQTAGPTFDYLDTRFSPEGRS
jgi:hypothetical protein